MWNTPSNFEVFISTPILWVAAFMIICPLLPLILPPIIGIFTAMREDPENANLKAILEANFSFVHKFIDYIQSKRKPTVSEKLAKEFPAVYKFVYNYGCRVTKFDTILAIDERKKKWVCINDSDMPVWNFSDIDDAEFIEEEKRFYILIRTKRKSFPEIRIESYDKASAERLLNTVNNMRTSVQNNLYSKYE